jgi:hypothetical protein
MVKRGMRAPFVDISDGWFPSGTHRVLRGCGFWITDQEKTLPIDITKRRIYHQHFELKIYKKIGDRNLQY